MFKETNFSENTILAAIYLIKSLSNQKKSPQEIFDSFKEKYFISPELNFKLENKNILSLVARKFEKEKDITIDKTDGLTIEAKDYRFNLRKSNTEPLVRLNLEANSPEILDKKKRELVTFLTKLSDKKRTLSFD